MNSLPGAGAFRLARHSGSTVFSECPLIRREVRAPTTDVPLPQRCVLISLTEAPTLVFAECNPLLAFSEPSNSSRRSLKQAGGLVKAK